MKPIVNQALEFSAQIENNICAFCADSEKPDHQISVDEICKACNIPKNDVENHHLTWVNFFYAMRCLRYEGVIYGDDTSLGKSMAIIAYLGVLKEICGNIGPHLIVTPTSRIHVWKQEFEKWCPSLNVMSYYGACDQEEARQKYGYDDEERKEARRPMKAIDLFKDVKGKYSGYHVLIASYSVLGGAGVENNWDHGFLKTTQVWDSVIMDEAHLLKDPTSLCNKSMHKIAARAVQRIVMTSSPLSHNPQDLWVLLTYVMPKYFDANKMVMEDCFGKVKKKSEVEDVVSMMRKILKPFTILRADEDV